MRWKRNPFGCQYRAVKRVRIQFFSSFLYFPLLMAAKTMINCQIKCKFICGSSANGHTKSQKVYARKYEKGIGKGNIRMENEIKDDLAGGEKGTCQIVKENWNISLKWNKIEMQEMNDTIRYDTAWVENMIRKTHFALNKSLCEFEKWCVCVLTVE